MFKRFISCAAALAMAFGAAAYLPESFAPQSGIMAQAEEYGDFEYTVIDDGTVEIRNYTGSDTDVNIPSKIDGKKVTSIGDSAFTDCNSCKCITIPTGITKIGNWAFAGCTALSSIKMPKKMTYIGHHAFSGCKSLIKIDIPYGIKNIYDYTCFNCDNLKEVNLPYTLENIGYSAFFYTSIEQIYIPDNVVNIEAYAFGAKLHYVSIPNHTKYCAGARYGPNNSFWAYDVEYNTELSFRNVIPNNNICENERIDFSFKGATDKKSHNYSFDYSDDLFLEDANNENLDIAQVSVGLAMAAYNKTTINYCLTAQMGFEIKDNYNYDFIPTFDNNDTVAYTIAHKKINGFDVYVVPIRGTYGNCEWLSDFNLGTGSEHTGFYKAANAVELSLMKVFKADKIDNNKTIVLFTGHSRGAAVANILAGRFSTTGMELNGTQVDIPTDCIFGYTFACPAVSKNAKTSLKNIYNYNNPGDLISELPLSSWGFKRYGIDKPLYTEKTKSAFLHSFCSITGLKYLGENNATSFVEALKLLAPTQKDYNSPSNQVLFSYIATLMMEDNRIPYTKDEIIEKACKKYNNGVIKESVVLSIIKILNNKKAKYVLAFFVADNVIYNENTHSICFNAKNAITQGHTGETYISGIEALKSNNVTTHKYITKVIAPTTTAQGYTLHTCSVCGNSYKDRYKEKLTRTSIAIAMVLDIKNKTYTGKSLTQAPVVKIGQKVLKKGTDYTVSYKNNKSVGKATVTIKGKGNYTGTISRTFKIKPKKTTLKTAASPKTKQLKVTYSKVSGVTGYQITYSTSSKFAKGSMKSINASGTSKIIKKLTKGKTYYVKVRTYKTVGGVKYYSGYSAVKKVKIRK